MVALYEYVEGEHKKELKYDQLDQLIEKLAALHLITSNLKIDGYQNRWNYGVRFCQEYIEENLRKKTSKTSKKKREWLTKELSDLLLNDELTKGIVHEDLDTSNLIFKNQELKSIIDFDDSNYTYLVLDLIGIVDKRKYKF